MKLPAWQVVLIILAAVSGAAQPFLARGVAKAAQTTAHTAVKLAHPQSTHGALPGEIRPNLLPDPKLTPGAAFTADASVICAAKFRTGKYRNTSKSLKKAVCAEYGVKDCPHEGTMEIDHLIPIELGGADVKENLWPQFAPDFRWKDLLENRLHALVCLQPTLAQQNADLAQAQEEIRTDWVKAYNKYIGPLPVN